MSIEYSAAVVWLPDGRIDPDAAMAAAEEVSWSTTWAHPWRTELTAGDARDLLDQFDRESWSHDVPASVADAIARLRSAVPDADDDAMSDDLYHLYAVGWVALLVQMILGGGDGQFDVASVGAVITFGADERGADADRDSVRRLSWTLTDPDFEAFREALLAGGAVAPSRWRLEHA